MSKRCYLKPISLLKRLVFNTNKSKLKLRPRAVSIEQPFTRSFTNIHGGNSIRICGNLECTVSDVLKKWKQKFLENDVSEPQESVEYILAHVLGSKKVSDVYSNSSMTLLPAVVQRIDKLCKQRIKRMPVQYIIQEWDFRDLTLKMSRPVFIPRPETEMLVDIVLNEIDNKGIDKVLELCCGSGAISLALLKSRTELHVTAVDKSENACKLTEENAIINNLSDRLTIIQSEISANSQFEAITETYDIIVSNPPYVPSKDMDYLQPEIKLYEDPAALDGGEDGLNVIKSILNICSRLLNYDGKLYLEVNPTHSTLIKSWLQANDSNLVFLRSYTDFSGKERFVELKKEE